jgi:hypothetical protein
MDQLAIATAHSSLNGPVVQHYAAPAGIRGPALKICKLCGKRFKQQDGLDVHLREVHHMEPGEASRTTAIPAALPPIPGQNRAEWSEFDEEV